MQQSDISNDRVQDAQTVTAVRGGDVERYRDLVERHERRVFAVAWSRLGDATLAEEATQEAFIRGYRRLWLLGDGEKFAGWIMAIARRAAINLGLRHRRELNKRARWALEQTEAPGISRNEPADTCTPEMLRQAMEELPAAHRECLVLFYLEGRSGTEAAAALGISEAAFRVRLLRARAAVREHLEKKLESSLEKLRPAKSLVPAVMAAVLVSSSAKAAAGGTVALGAGAKIASLLGKTVLFSWFLPLIGLIGMLPTLGLVWITERMERRNFRDKDDFRLKLRWEFKNFAWFYLLLTVPILVLFTLIVDYTKINIDRFYLFFTVLMAIVILISARSLTIQRNSYQDITFMYAAIFVGGSLVQALGWIPLRYSQIPLFVACLLTILLIKKAPRRMDYSLFLRAAEGLLRFNADANQNLPALRFDRRSLLAFARFLGSRNLVINFRWEKGGLALRLPDVKPSFKAVMAFMFLPPIPRGCPHILLGWDGTVAAHSSSKDLADSLALKPDRCIEAPELERLVAEGVRSAWREFRERNLAAAAETLGEVPEAEVFIVPPARSKSTRLWQLFQGGLVLLMGVLIIAQVWWVPRRYGLNPVSVTESQVRNFLSDIQTNRLQSRVDEPQNSPAWPLSTSFVLPSKDLFSPTSLQEMKENVFAYNYFRPQEPKERRLSDCDSCLLRPAFQAGWIDWNDVGLKPEEMTKYLHDIQTNKTSLFNWGEMLTDRKLSSGTKNEEFP